MKVRVLFLVITSCMVLVGSTFAQDTDLERSYSQWRLQRFPDGKAEEHHALTVAAEKQFDGSLKINAMAVGQRDALILSVELGNVITEGTRSTFKRVGDVYTGSQQLSPAISRSMLSLVVPACGECNAIQVTWALDRSTPQKGPTILLPLGDRIAPATIGFVGR